MRDELELLDWKRRMFELYAEVRAASDPEAGWRHWRDVRDELFRTHPQSAVPPDRRERLGTLEYFPYDPALRVLAEVEEAPDEAQGIAGSAGSVTTFRRFGRVAFEVAGTGAALDLYWLEGYAAVRSCRSGTRRAEPRRTAAAATSSTRSRGPISAWPAATSCSTSTSPTTPPARTTRAGPARSRRPRTGSLSRCARGERAPSI